MASSESTFPVGSRVAERGYDHNRGVVTGHASDGWTFVKWDTGLAVMSYPPYKLVSAS